MMRKSARANTNLSGYISEAIRIMSENDCASLKPHQLVCAFIMFFKMEIFHISNIQLYHHVYICVNQILRL